MDFSSEEEVRKALKCNREYMGKDAGRPHATGWQGFAHSVAL